MTVLVTGGAGYIGSHTVLELLRAGYDVVCVDDLSAGSEEIFRRACDAAGRPGRFYRADVRDAAALDAVFDDNKVDAVMHFAGLKSPGQSVAAPLSYYDANIRGALTLLCAMKRHGVSKLVFSSSASVYGNAETMPVTEDTPKSPPNPYAATKSIIEDILAGSARAESLSAISLRYFNPVGADPSGAIGERVLGVPQNLMPHITETAVGLRDALEIFGNDYPTPDGTGIRDYIHVCDLARAHICALEKLDGAPGHTIYNVGTGRGVSVLELIQTFEQINSVKINYKFVPRRAGDIGVSFADVSRAREELGFVSRLGVEDMCRDAYKWQKEGAR